MSAHILSKSKKESPDNESSEYESASLQNDKLFPNKLVNAITQKYESEIFKLAKQNVTAKLLDTPTKSISTEQKEKKIVTKVNKLKKMIYHEIRDYVSDNSSIYDVYNRAIQDNKSVKAAIKLAIDEYIRLQTERLMQSQRVRLMPTTKTTIVPTVYMMSLRKPQTRGGNSRKKTGRKMNKTRKLYNKSKSYNKT